MSAVWKGALIGLLVAVAAVGVAAFAVSAGLLPDSGQLASDHRVLVIATAPDEGGTDLAALAFVVEPTGNRVTLLSTMETATIAGTSASTPRDALPFGGGEAVAQALSAQTGGVVLGWVVIPDSEWADMVDDAGGVQATVPSGVSAYTRGALTIVAPGSHMLTGRDAVALASSASHMEDAETQAMVLRQLTARVSAIVGASGDRMRAMVTSGTAQSSLDPSEIPDLQPVR